MNIYLNTQNLKQPEVEYGAKLDSDVWLSEAP